MKTLADIFENVSSGAPFWMWRNITGGYDWHICTLFSGAEEIRFISRGEEGSDDFTCFTDNYLDGLVVEIQEPETP